MFVNRYRGRQRRRKGLVVLTVTLGLVVAVFVGGFFVLQSHLVYTNNEDGTMAVRFDFPYFNNDEPPAAQPAVGTNYPDTSPPPPSATPTPAPTPTPTPAPQRPLRAVFVTLSQLASGDETTLASVRALAEQKVIDAVVLEIKDETGRLAYPSSVPLAIQAGVSADSDGAVAFIRALNALDLYVVGRVSVFRDATLPQKDARVGVKHSTGVNWLDKGRIRWLDPYKEPARNYMLDILSEVSDLGVDEILLSRFCFPYFGSINSIRYGEDAETPKHTVQENFAQEIAERLKTRDVALSVAWEAVQEYGEEAPASGQRVSALWGRFQRLYVDVPIADTGAVTADFREKVGSGLSAARLSARLIPMLSVPNNTTPDALEISLDGMGDSWVVETANIADLVVRG